MATDTLVLYSFLHAVYYRATGKDKEVSDPFIKQNNQFYDNQSMIMLFSIASFHTYNLSLKSAKVRLGIEYLRPAILFAVVLAIQRHFIKFFRKMRANMETSWNFDDQRGRGGAKKLTKAQK